MASRICTCSLAPALTPSATGTLLPVGCVNDDLYVDMPPSSGTGITTGPLANAACLQATIEYAGDSAVQSAGSVTVLNVAGGSPIGNYLTTPPITLTAPCGRQAKGLLAAKYSVAGDGVTLTSDLCLAQLEWSIDGGATWGSRNGTILSSPPSNAGAYQVSDLIFLPITVPIGGSLTMLARVGFGSLTGPYRVIASECQIAAWVS